MYFEAKPSKICGQIVVISLVVFLYCINIANISEAEVSLICRFHGCKPEKFKHLLISFVERIKPLPLLFIVSSFFLKERSILEVMRYERYE